MGICGQPIRRLLRPDLWRIQNSRQVYLTTLLNHPLGHGPAVSACAFVPDLHHFRGSYGAKEAFPLFRDIEGTEPNILPGLLELLAARYGKAISADDFLAYIYGVLAHPRFTSRFERELGTRELRVPVTKNAVLFEKARAAGAHLLWLHTFGERFVPAGSHPGSIPPGTAKCTKSVPGDDNGFPETFEYDATTKTLNVGAGRFAPVQPEAYEFEVSGLKVLQSWLSFRMKDGAGRQGSPLNEIHAKNWSAEFTSELLALLSVLEATVKGFPEQAELLEELIDGDLFAIEEFPAVPDEMRNAPKTPELVTQHAMFES